MKTTVKDLKRTVKNLLTRKGRTFLTVLGIVIGVAGVIIITSLGAGAQSLVLSQITKVGSNLVGVLPGKSNENGPPAAVFGVQVTTLKDRDLQSIKDKRNVPHVTDAAPFVRSNVTIVSGRESVDTSFTATDGSYPRIQTAEMSEGTFFTDQQANSGDKVIVLGYDVANSLFPNSDPLGKIVKIKIPPQNLEQANEDLGSIPFRVIGIQKKMGTVAFQNQDDQVFIPFSIGQRQLLGIDYIQFIRMKVDSGDNVKETISEVTSILRSNHNIRRGQEDDFSVRDLADAIKILTNVTGTLKIFLGLMAGISLVVGGIGIMNILLVTVSERTREIGLRKAIGATKKNIRNQFLFESIVLTSAGGFIGIILGIIISYLISIGVRFAGYDWEFIVSFLSVLLAVGVSVSVGLVFGIYPAVKASKLDPIVALRYE